MKRAVWTVLALLLVSPVAFSNARALAAGAWVYELDKNKDAIITGYTGNETTLTVPAMLDGHAVTAIGSDAFTDDPITSITIPDGVTAIDSGAFWECKDLQSILVGDGNPKYKSDDGILFSKDGLTLLHFPAGKGQPTDGYAVPAGVATIGRCAFDHNQKLQNITLPDSVTRIEEAAFWRCNSLKTFTVPKNAVEIGGSVFANCVSLSSFAVAAGNPAFQSVDGVLFDSTGKLLKQYPAGRAGAYTVPDGVETICEGAFRGSNGLKQVTICDSVTSIDGAAFAFCEELTDVRLGKGLKRMGSIAFQCCFSLKSIVIPFEVEALDGMAFESCESMTGIYFMGDVPVFGGDDFRNTAEGFTVHCCKSLAKSWEAYKEYPVVVFYIVAYDSCGGSDVPDQLADAGSKLMKPDDPVMENQLFGGWYTDKTYTDMWDFSVDTATTDMTLYAKWNRCPTISPVMTGGAGESSMATPSTEPTASGWNGTQTVSSGESKETRSNGAIDNGLMWLVAVIAVIGITAFLLIRIRAGKKRPKS